MQTENRLQERDRRVIWHPYSQHGLHEDVLPVQSAHGAYLKLEDGREVIDGISSWWVNLHGHAHPKIVQAISEQAAKMEHVIFAGFTHEPAVRLAELILAYPSVSRANLKKAFYSDNGSTAVEVALKMAFQYHLNRTGKQRPRFLALSDSYHGDTLGAMAVGEPDGFHSIFRSLLPQVDFVRPDDLDGFQALVHENRGQYSAFIFEPLVQGAAGMKMYSASFLKNAVEICRSEEILTICDEVFTGFYRTGRCFAFESVDIEPDFLCLSKGITGGFLPLAVTLTRESVFDAFLSKDIRTAFLHGHSYTANPIACAAGIESWRLLHSLESLERIEKIVAQTKVETQALESHSRVKSIRFLGTIGVIEVNQDGNYFSGNLKALTKTALEQGVFLRPLGNVLYVLPPYCITSEELSRVYRAVKEILNRV